MLFLDDHRHGTADQRRLYALFEILTTAIDLSAAALFVAGSFVFLSEDRTQTCDANT